MRVDWCVSSWFRIKNTHSLREREREELKREKERERESEQRERERVREKRERERERERILDTKPRRHTPVDSHRLPP